jgi:hypothetical protein
MLELRLLLLPNHAAEAAVNFPRSAIGQAFEVQRCR